MHFKSLVAPYCLSPQTFGANQTIQKRQLQLRSRYVHQYSQTQSRRGNKVRTSLQIKSIFLSVVGLVTAPVYRNKTTVEEHVLHIFSAEATPDVVNRHGFIALVCGCGRRYFSKPSTIVVVDWDRIEQRCSVVLHSDGLNAFKSRSSNTVCQCVGPRNDDGLSRTTGVVHNCFFV